ncbi:lipoprotein [Rhodopirellula maiorica SM1]|uniref:Lipoprotein n=1 Tax=Rhodopirellula maiorica SM1 TaxID=1265738 RepID=M5RG89_9BACT|nr:lipoprotein [Rhodopirellula maiorica SM1]
MIRVPVDRYHEFVSGVGGLGFAESRREDAQDVTEEYVDVEARVRNNRKLEERIITMLAERTGKLSDVLEIERELARVREEIERMEGRLRLLADRTALATVTINVREEKEYVPPAAPTFSDRVATAFGGSLSSLRQLSENLLIALIALVPWIIVLGIPVTVVTVMVRRRIHTRTAIE